MSSITLSGWELLLFIISWLTLAVCCCLLMRCPEAPAPASPLPEREREIEWSSADPCATRPVVQALPAAVARRVAQTAPPAKRTPPVPIFWMDGVSGEQVPLIEDFAWPMLPGDCHAN